MKKNLLIFFLVLALTVGCGAPAASIPETAIPTQTIVKPTASPTSIPTETLIPVPLVTLPPPGLPVCSPEDSVTGCEAPTVTELDRFCAQEKPYTLYAFPAGTTVESVTPNFTCNDEGLRKGNQQYSCTGMPGFTFRARVCNTACVTPVDRESEQCPRGYGINTANNCCVPVQNTVNGCVEINLQIGMCQ